MNFYKVNPNYINFLRQKQSIIMECKDNISSTGGRKYFGVCLEVNNFNYFVPITHGGISDYFINNKGFKIAKQDGTTSKKIKSNENRLLSVLKMGNMIPIPKDEISIFDFTTEPDPKLRKKWLNILNKVKTEEFQNDLKKRCANLYNSQKHAKSLDTPFWNNVVNFTLAEEMCMNWIKQKNIVNDKTDLDEYSINDFPTNTIKANNDKIPDLNIQQDQEFKPRPFVNVVKAIDKKQQK